MKQTDDIPSKAQAEVMKFVDDFHGALEESESHAWELFAKGWIASDLKGMAYRFDLTDSGRAALARYREQTKDR